MNIDQFTIRLNRFADDLERAADLAVAAAARPETASRGAAACRSVASDGISMYDALSGVDPIGLSNPLDVIQAAAWLADTRTLLGDGVASVAASGVGLARLAAGGRIQIRKHVVRAGDTLQAIAASMLGDWRLWTKILDANHLDPAAALTVGAELIIPEPDGTA